MELKQAESLAADRVEQMRPYCERVAVAGSVRRGKADVRDLEIVAISKWETRTERTGLFAEEQSYQVNLLREWATNESGWNFIKPGTGEIIPWDIQPDGKYWRVYLGDVHMKLDIFLCEPETWGYIFMLRTGSADFNEAVARRGVATGHRYTTEGMRGCREERECFARLGLAYVPPELRRGGQVFSAIAPRQPPRLAQT